MKCDLGSAPARLGFLAPTEEDQLDRRRPERHCGYHDQNEHRPTLLLVAKRPPVMWLANFDD